MRFLMLNWRDPKNPSSGGAERVSEAYLRRLVERGHEVAWFSNAFPHCEAEEVINGIKIVRGGGKGSSILHAKKWFHTQPRFDLVIDQHHGIPWYAPWWCRTRCIAYIHEVLGPVWKAFYPWPISTFGQWQERRTHRLYRNVPFWVPSESTKKNLHRCGVKEVTVIPNGVDTTPLSELAPKPLKPPLRLIVVSRLAPNKRIDHCLHILKSLMALGVPATLKVVGSGDMENSLKQLAKQLEIEAQVEFVGRLPEAQKNEALQKAHFLLHTSVREGWGLNVLEANAMGTSAVVYPVEGLVDSTLEGETGWITSRERPEEAAETIASLLKRPEDYDRIRKNAWERSRQFQWDVVLPSACRWLEEQAQAAPPPASR